MRLKHSISVLFLSFICFYSFLFAQETLTITTYYPSPYGSYRELRSQRMAIGDTYNNISTVCWGLGCGGATVIPDAADLIVEGFVGIGTAVPGSILHLSSGAATTDLTVTNTVVPVEGVFKVGSSGGINRMFLGTLTAHDLAFSAGNTTRMTIVGAGANAGNVGIGTINPQQTLDFGANNMRIGWGGRRALEGNIAGTMLQLGEGYSTTALYGNVGIGTTTPTAVLDVVGGIKLDIAASPPVGSAVTYILGQRELRRDLAELFDTSEDVEAGDVLCITTGGKLKKSNKSYDTSVAGIVSEAPAIIFEGNRLQVLPQPYKFTSGRKPPLALAGRVLCKVTTENGSINRGDLLVTSSKPGYAMKGDPEKIQIGTVLGKAMEPLEKGEGKITVLVALQ